MVVVSRSIVCATAAVGRIGHGRERHGGTALLHHDRRQPRVERAGGEQPLDGELIALRRHVVDVGVEHDDFVAARRGCRRGADQHAHDVGERKIAAAGAVAHGVERHVDPLPRPNGERTENRRTGDGDELGPDVDHAQRLPAQELGCRARFVRSARHVRDAMAGRERRAAQPSIPSRSSAIHVPATSRIASI